MSYRAVCGALFALCFVFSPASQRILLVPLDSRPAAAQFPQLIGDISSVRVEIPPMNLLGRFTSPGNPEEISRWLMSQDYSDVVAVVVSSDMLAYGGLIASRVPDVSIERAKARLAILNDLRRKHPSVPIYTFSALMRTAPTATNESRSWRMGLARFVELEERFARTGERHLPGEMAATRRIVPERQLERYRSARKRNLEIHKELVRLTKSGAITYLVIGADDAQKYGPHYPETQELRRLVSSLMIDGLVYFCEGIDQHANLLTSRAVLRHNRWTPHVWVRLSNPAAANRPATYESQPLAHSIRDQIIASGARPAEKPEDADYVLYLNAPGTDDDAFRTFAVSLAGEMEQSLSVAVADINFDRNGGSDSRLVDEVWKQHQSGGLLAFAGWNTAGNTIGTAVPHANLYLLSRRNGNPAIEREVAQRRFLLHRLVNDYGYHKYIRPLAYRIVDEDPAASREEAYGAAFRRLEDWVVRNTTSLLEKYFREQFLHQPIAAGDDRYRIADLKDVRVSLPWPRAFEVRIDFDFVVEPVIEPAAERRVSN